MALITVIAIALVAHGCDDFVVGQELSVVARTILALSIRMMDDARRRLTNGGRAFQSGERQILLHAIAGGLADDASGKQIDDAKRGNTFRLVDLRRR